MPVTRERPGPYAPSSAVLDLIDRRRNRGLQAPINAEVLQRAGVSDSLVSRTLQALQTLDLIDEGGAPTPAFEAIRLAPETEYKQRLAEWLKGAYHEIFAFVDPMVDDETRIRDAFRGYEPQGQMNRMVTLFTGLCKAAGLMPDASPQPAAKATSNPSPKPLTPRARTTVKRIVNERFKDAPRHPSGLPSPLRGLLDSLPAEGDSWSKEERGKFITTFTAVLDFCFPVEDAPKPKNETGGH